MKAGVHHIGASGGQPFVATWVPFDSPMDHPIVICTVSNLDGFYDDSFNVTTRWVQDIGFEAIIRRQDEPTPWGANLVLHWMAIER